MEDPNCFGGPACDDFDLGSCLAAIKILSNLGTLSAFLPLKKLLAVVPGASKFLQIVWISLIVK